MLKVTDWEIGKNAAGTPWCTKGLGNVTMIIFEGINGEPCNLRINGNLFIKENYFTLGSHDFDSASREADDIYRAELKKIIISAKEQLGVLSKMRFFKFTNYPYFALISAETEEQAVKHYEEEVSDIEEGNGPPEELTMDEAKTEYLSHAKGEHEQELSKLEFEDYINDSKPVVLLIDGCLV